MENIEDLKQEIANLQGQIKRLEKMSSLGVLTAGIMHEIRNPLNFVINFSKMSTGLLKDFEEDLEANESKIDEDDLDDMRNIMGDLQNNLTKIMEHGERAFDIIQDILLYSRGKEGERLPTDLCKLVKEYVWLSYHAMRANYKNFNVKVKESYEASLPKLNVVPQDISRAVLNVVNNACYTVWEKSQELGEVYHPELDITVRKVDNEVEIVVGDNGKGMSEEVKQKLYDNFFTTKPVGQGTGLGMNITRDIIENKHHGHISFASTEGEGTTFSLFIPMV